MLKASGIPEYHHYYISAKSYYGPAHTHLAVPHRIILLLYNLELDNNTCNQHNELVCDWTDLIFIASIYSIAFNSRSYVHVIMPYGHKFSNIRLLEFVIQNLYMVYGF